MYKENKRSPFLTPFDVLPFVTFVFALFVVNIAVLSRSSSLKSEISSSLKSLDTDVLLGSSPISINSYGWGVDDLCLLPDLRSLTCVEGVVWPERVRKYLEEGFENCQAELYWEYQVE